MKLAQFLKPDKKPMVVRNWKLSHTMLVGIKFSANILAGNGSSCTKALGVFTAHKAAIPLLECY